MREYNELPTAKSKNIGQIALEVVKEPMFVLLLVCSSIYLLLGDYTEGIMLSASILIIIFITFYQYQKTERAIESLRQLSSPKAMVIRNGETVKIPGREIVIGDIVLINEGDRIPADGILIHGTNLSVDESMLTGESIPVSKDTLAYEGSSQVFSGTLVVQGSGKLEVNAIGIHTEFGKIGKSLQQIVQDPTRLQKRNEGSHQKSIHHWRIFKCISRLRLLPNQRRFYCFSVIRAGICHGHSSRGIPCCANYFPGYWRLEIISAKCPDSKTLCY